MAKCMIVMVNLLLALVGILKVHVCSNFMTGCQARRGGSREVLPAPRKMKTSVNALKLSFLQPSRKGVHCLCIMHFYLLI